MQITVETLVRADPAIVWSAWTTPADIVQWNAASDDWHTTAATVDLRPGGTFTSRMEAKDGSAGFDFAGLYTDVVPERRLAFLMGDARTVTIAFEPETAGTRVRETFDADEGGPHSVEQQRQGWQSILDRFARHAEAKADAPMHRRFGGRTNNRAWGLVDKTDRTPLEDRELLDAAHASAWHWRKAGTELQRRRAEMLVCAAHAALGLGGPQTFAVATAMRDWFLAQPDTPDWERAFAHAVHASAASASGLAADHGTSWTAARSAIDAIADAEERAIVEGTFATVPRPVAATSDGPSQRQIVVLGAADARAETVDEALRLAAEHVARSRAEPGCLAHGVSRSADAPNRLVFVERWTDRAALAAHVALPASRAFGRALASLCEHAPEMTVWDAAAVGFAELLAGTAPGPARPVPDGTGSPADPAPRGDGPASPVTPAAPPG